MNEKKESTISAFSLNLISGFIAGTWGTIVGHPLDTLKIRVQLSNEKVSPLQTFRNVINEEGRGSYSRGFARLFKGVVPPICGTAPIIALLFSTNSMLNNVTKDWQIPHHFIAFICGYISGGIISWLVTPVELLKIRKQAKNNIGVTYPKIIKQQLKEWSIKGLWRGWRITFFRCSTPNGMFFFTNSMLRGILNADPKKDSGTRLFFKRFLAAGLGGQTYWLVGYPFDVIKIRIC